MSEEQVCEACGSVVECVSTYAVRCVKCGQYAEPYSTEDELVPWEKIRRRAAKEDSPGEDYE